MKWRWQVFTMLKVATFTHCLVQRVKTNRTTSQPHVTELDDLNTNFTRSVSLHRRISQMKQVGDGLLRSKIQMCFLELYADINCNVRPPRPKCCPSEASLRRVAWELKWRTVKVCSITMNTVNNIHGATRNSNQGNTHASVFKCYKCAEYRIYIYIYIFIYIIFIFRLWPTRFQRNVVSLRRWRGPFVCIILQHEPQNYIC